MRYLIIVFLIIFSITGLFAETIDLEEARVMALANSRSLKRYEMAIRSSILDERTQLYSMIPQVSAGYSASMFFVKDWEFVDPIDNLSAGAQFSITQIIFQGGKSFLQKAISAIGTESVRIDALSEYFNVLDAVDNAYYAVLEAAATLEAEESSHLATVLALSIAEVRHTSGMINMGDYLKALADFEARENSFNNARRNLTISMNKFKSLTGIEGTVVLKPINFDMYENIITYLAGISDDEAQILFNDFWDLLVESNPSLKKAELNNQRAVNNLKLTRRDYSPVISASIFSSDISFLPSYNTSGSSGVAIRGTIPVDFWVMNNRIEKSRISMNSTALDYKNIESNLEQELQNALFSLFWQAGTVLSSRRSLEYTQRHYEYVMERYRLLQSSVSDLSEASTLFINSRNNSTKATYNFLQSLSKLRSLCAINDEQKLLELIMRNEE